VKIYVKKFSGFLSLNYFLRVFNFQFE
jgi:hypothetical protein